MLTIDTWVKHIRSRCAWYEVLPGRNGITDITSGVKHMVITRITRILINGYFIFFFVGLKRHGHQFFMFSHNQKDAQHKPADRDRYKIHVMHFNRRAYRNKDKKESWNNSQEQNKKSPIQKTTSFRGWYCFDRIVDRLVFNLCHGHQFLMSSYNKKDIQNKSDDREYYKINLTRLDGHINRNKDEKKSWNNSPKDTNENPIPEATSLQWWIFFHRLLHGIFLFIISVYQKSSIKIESLSYYYTRLFSIYP